MAPHPKDPKYLQRPWQYRRAVEVAPRRTGWYIWRVPPGFAARTRPEHLRLDGQRFRWDEPPVVDARTGARGHPGHDPRCRCYAEPAAGPQAESHAGASAVPDATRYSPAAAEGDTDVRPAQVRPHGRSRSP